MLNINFSLSESIGITPILNMRAKPALNQAAPTIVRVGSFLESEIVSRIVALALSIFAIIDTMAHLLAAGYKEISLSVRLARQLPPPAWDQAEVETHLKKSLWHLKVAIVGSVGGFILPDVVSHFAYVAPPAPAPAPVPLVPPPGIQGSPLDVQTREIRDGTIQAPFAEVAAIWPHRPLAERKWFVDTFNQANDPIAQLVRQHLTPTIYRPTSLSNSLGRHNVSWLPQEEVNQRVNAVWNRHAAHNAAFFFHATSRDNLEAILRSQQVEVRHQANYRGAFVSTLPETDFGTCILGFKKNIEQLSPITRHIPHTAHFRTFRPNNTNGHWIGFSEAIPVTDQTLAYIMIDGTEQQRQALAAQCPRWAGRPIEVFRLEDMRGEIQTVENLNLGIPAEWA